jgi:hypothetical protein
MKAREHTVTYDVRRFRWLPWPRIVESWTKRVSCGEAELITRELATSYDVSDATIYVWHGDDHSLCEKAMKHVS